MTATHGTLVWGSSVLNVALLGRHATKLAMEDSFSLPGLLPFLFFK